MSYSLIREYDYSIKKVKIGVQDLYNNCRAILKSEGFLEEE